MNEKVVVVREALVNEYGSGYGYRYLVFAVTPEDADQWIRQNLDGPDGEPYWNGRSVWDQVRVETITAYDRDGNLSRAPWWDLLAGFTSGSVEADVIKKIARLNAQARLNA